jgi:hypothetical protein
VDSRVRISAIHEPLAGRDEQLGLIFTRMRQTMNVSRETIARRLATRASTIDDFEAGAITALPNWKETNRIVRGYCELLRLDPEPILWRIRSHLEAVANQVRAPRPAPVAARPASVRPDGMPASMVRERTETGRPQAARRRRRVRTLFTLSAPIVLLAGMVFAAQAVPQVVYPALAFLPDQVELPVRAGLEYLVLLTASRRDGLRWIEVADPKIRKADKLPTR